MILRVLSVSLLASLWSAQEADAFSSLLRVNTRTPSSYQSFYASSSRLRVASIEEVGEDTVITDSVLEAVELLEDDETEEVLIQNEMPQPETTKRELLSDIQDVMETVEEDTATTADATAESKKTGLAHDIARRFQFFQEPEVENVTVEEAAVSASLYMNPATEKIAENLIVTWEPDVAQTLLQLEKVSNPNRPFMVGIVGIPGSGKSTSSEILAALLGDDRAIVMPMDGFHIPLAQLAEFPNAADAIYRRGAPDTFNAAELAADLDRIAYGKESVVTIPGFDHAVGDPTPNQHSFVRDQHRIVICEGLYLLHDDHGWENVKSFFDWTIYIDANVDACIERLKERNKCIPGYTPEEIEIRCDAVDRVNAETSRDGAYKHASQIVKSGASQ